MPRHYDNEEEEDGPDEFDEDDYDPDDPETYPQGLYDDDGPATIPCPHCSEDILEDSERCPSCGTYLSKEDTPTQSRSGLWMVLTILAFLAALMLIIGCG
jgi:predicted nucleic acid-binding Zn ribbon protein